MTLDDVLPLFEYWKRYPPLRDLVASFVGFKPKDAAEPEPPKMNADSMRLLMRSTGGKIPGMGPK